jgi:hypothetical protein
MIYVSHAYFYVSRSIWIILDRLFTYLTAFCDVAYKVSYSWYIFKYKSDYFNGNGKTKNSINFMAFIAEYGRKSAQAVITWKYNLPLI